MKKLIPIIIILTLIIGGIFVFGQGNRGTQLTMKLPSDLQKAVNIMEGIQSNSLNGGIAGEGISDSDIAHMQSVYDGIDDYMGVLDRDLVGKERNLSSILLTDRGASVEQISNITTTLKTSDFWISDGNVHTMAAIIMIAVELGVSDDDIREEADLLEAAFYLSATRWTKQMYWRFGIWFENFKGNQCRSNDYGNDPDVYGYVMMENTAQGEEGEQLADTCSADGTKVIQHVCSNRQYDGTNEMVCEYGCQEGVCLDEPVIVIPDPIFDGFHLGVNHTPIAGEAFDLMVIAKNSDGSIADDYDGSIYFQVLGIDLKQSDFSRDTDNTLVNGVGSFPMSLVSGEDKSINDVTIIVTDVAAGVSERVDLGELVVGDLDNGNGSTGGQSIGGVSGSSCKIGEKEYCTTFKTPVGATYIQTERCECYNSNMFGCTDSSFDEYNDEATIDDGSCGIGSIPILGCTDTNADNFDAYANINDGTCNYGGGGGGENLGMTCTDSDAHNYDTNYDPMGSYEGEYCETCDDGKKNGDEEDVDCGGEKCKKCDEDDDDDDEGGDEETPTYYCDIPEAVNYEQYDEDDESYQAEAYTCNFCGNGTTEGKVNSDGSVDPVTMIGDGGTEVAVYESCDDGENDKPYDGCYACQIEQCEAEWRLCKEYEFSGSESSSQLGSKLSSGPSDYPWAKRTEWINGSADVVKKDNRDFATFGSQCIRLGEDTFTSFDGVHTEFGYQDSEDNGLGSATLGSGCRNCKIQNITNETIYTGYSGEVNTNNQTIRGVALPKKLLDELFGPALEVRKLRVQVTGPNGCFSYPVVDFGPAEFTWTRMCDALLDMTVAAADELGIRGQHKQVDIRWDIVENAGVDTRDVLTQKEADNNKTSSTWSSNAYTYRTNTTMNYPGDYFTTTACN